MSEITTVVLDAMGGDNAPAAMIDGAIDAISKEKNVKVILVGIEDVIRKGLEGKTYKFRRDSCGRTGDRWQNQRC